MRETCHFLFHSLQKSEQTKSYFLLISFQPFPSSNQTVLSWWPVKLAFWDVCADEVWAINQSVFKLLFYWADTLLQWLRKMWRNFKYSTLFHKNFQFPPSVFSISCSLIILGLFAVHVNVLVRLLELLGKVRKSSVLRINLCVFYSLSVPCFEKWIL